VSESEKPEPARSPESLPTGELPEQSGKEVRVPYWDSPAPPPVGHEIHPRQYIPPPPEGEEVADDTPSPPVGLE
jgi:hypothetical protein